MKGTGFLKQSGVLISRYLKIFFNDIQNLTLTIGIPLLTVIVVCLVASDDMFALQATNKVNDGYPLLSWEEVDYEIGSDDEDEEKSESVRKVWNGEIPQQPQLMPADSDGKEYYISSPGDLQFIAEAKGEWLEKTYYLNNDMDMDGKTITPIGTQNAPFKGKFKGNGHIISNFVIDAESDCVGLFGKISTEDSEISNLGIEDARIISSEENVKFIGIIVGENDGGLVENCFTVKSEIDVTGDYVGGIAGALYGDNENSAIRNCYSRADMYVDGDYVGGIVGNVEDGGIQYTYYAGTIEKKDDDRDLQYIGCIAGYLDDFNNSFNCVFDNELMTEFDAIGSSDDEWEESDKTIEGWSTEKLQENASLIRKSEKDAEDEPNGNFKNDGELASFSGTQTGLFMLACVAIFVGICNSVQEICKERNILKREYMTNLKLSSYMVSKLAVQGMVCAVQTLVVLIIFYLSVADKVYPSKGVILPSSRIESFITMFLLTYSADAIALLISSVVKNSSTANTFIPIILIVQIVFSGVLFELGGFMDKFANLMISKWGIGALAATYHLNESRVTMVLNNPAMTLQLGDDMSRIQDLYVSTPANLLKIWLILIMFVAICAVAGGLLLTRVKKDKR